MKRNTFSLATAISLLIVTLVQGIIIHKLNYRISELDHSTVVLDMTIQQRDETIKQLLDLRAKEEGFAEQHWTDLKVCLSASWITTGDGSEGCWIVPIRNGGWIHVDSKKQRTLDK